MKEKITKNYGKLVGDRKIGGSSIKPNSKKASIRKSGGCSGCSRRRSK